MSEISLIHEDDINWFITQDETHHEYDTIGHKGGSTATRWANNSFPRSGERVIENSSHTTGVYGYTFAGEPLPPLYITSTSSKNEDNYKFDSRMCEGLPMPRAKYAGDQVKSRPSRIAVLPKGSMDTLLWHRWHTDVLLPCWKDRLYPVPVRDPKTGKLIKGPLIDKTDAGPGRLSKEAQSIEFREMMADMGVHIMLSLPNGTSATAELDQLYSRFKDDCKKSTMRVAGIKMAERVKACDKG